mmetsp:Transcript_3804/g.3717  ORF Transcript_3804/g.3717 Transcript_3804/m.3717 type:complete len:122 (-) Transcript_3804:37-402(-)
MEASLGIAGRVGKMFGQEAGTFGLEALLIVTHHGLVSLWTRNFTVVLFIPYMISVFMFFPLTVVMNHFSPANMMFRTVLTSIMGGPKFWLVLILCASFFLLGTYAFKCSYYIFFKPELRQK